VPSPTVTRPEDQDGAGPVRTIASMRPPTGAVSSAALHDDSTPRASWNLIGGDGAGRQQVDHRVAIKHASAHPHEVARPDVDSVCDRYGDEAFQR
jgi:hypothetical protein